MVNRKKSSDSFNKEKSSPTFDTSQATKKSTTCKTMAPNNIYSDDRNILVCGSRGCGKTSLIFTISRGIFPGDFSPDITPGRFEGWSINATALPISAASPNISSGSTNNLQTQGRKEKIKPYNVSLTFWEDRPRLNLDLGSSSSSSSDEEENDHGK